MSECVLLGKYVMDSLLLSLYNYIMAYINE